MHGLDHKNPDILCILGDILSNPKYLDCVITKFKFEKALKNKELYVERLEVGLGTREERQYIIYGVQSQSVRVQDTMQYLPLESLLKTVCGPLISLYLLSNVK